VNVSNYEKQVNEQEIGRLLKLLSNNKKEEREKAQRRIDEIQKQINPNKKGIIREEKVLNSEPESNIRHLLIEKELPSGLFFNMRNTE